MNECEQTHPMLRGYLEDNLSARDRRLVARHLNLCASARKELDRLRSGPVKTPANPADKPSEPWDLKILRWLFKTQKPASSSRSGEESPKKTKSSPKPTPQPAKSGKRSSPLKPLLGILVFFLALAYLTHFVQNAGDSSAVKSVKRWLSKNGYNVMGVTPSLDLVLDLTNLPHWGGARAPAAVPFQQLVTDEDHFNILWSLLQPTIPIPKIDFTKNALAVVFLGPQVPSNYSPRFKVMKDYSDRTVMEYDEVSLPAVEIAAAPANPWVIQVVPKPAQLPVVIQKIQ